MKRILSTFLTLLLVINSTFVASPILAEDNLPEEEIVETTNEENALEETQEDKVLKCQELIDALPEEKNISTENVEDINLKVSEIKEILESLSEEEVSSLDISKYSLVVETINAIITLNTNNGSNNETSKEVPSIVFNYIDDDIDSKYLRHTNKSNLNKIDNDIVPKKFSLLNDDMSDGYVSSVKYQNPFGTCWAFAVIASAESNYLLKNNKTFAESGIDLSELQLAWFTYKNHNVSDKLSLITDDGATVTSGGVSDVLNAGGNSEFAMYALASGIGFSNEEFMKYPNDHSYATDLFIPNNDQYIEYCYHNDFILKNADIYDMSERTIVKKALMQNGAMAVSYRHYPGTAEEQENDDFYDYYGVNGYSYFYSSDSFNISTNHAVTLVGWDDEYSRDNFGKDGKPKPSGDGAWLVKNSWDDDFGFNGYFWISYEEHSLRSGHAFGFSIEKVDSDKNYNLYQYDGGIYSATYSTIGESANVVYSANIYTATRDERLESVGLAVESANIDYVISIYQDIVAGSPTSGTKILEQSGHIDNAGYHMIDLDWHKTSYPVKPLEKDDYYSIVIKYSSSGVVNIPVDYNASSNGITFISHTEDGQTYLSDDGISFEDLNNTEPGQRASTRVKGLCTPFKYYIEYDLDGGNYDENVSNPEEYYNENITLNNPKKEGYYFEGWYKDPEFDEGSKITEIKLTDTGDLKLYAKWKQLTKIEKIEFTIPTSSIPAAGVTPVTDNTTVLLNDGNIDSAKLSFALSWYKADAQGNPTENVPTMFWPNKDYCVSIDSNVDLTSYYFASEDELIITVNNESFDNETFSEDEDNLKYKYLFVKKYSVSDTKHIEELDISGFHFPVASTTKEDYETGALSLLINGEETELTDVKYTYEWFADINKTEITNPFVDGNYYYLFVTAKIDKDNCGINIFEEPLEENTYKINGNTSAIKEYAVNEDNEYVVFVLPFIAQDKPFIDSDGAFTAGETVYVDGVPTIADSNGNVDVDDVSKVSVVTLYGEESGASEDTEIKASHLKYPSSTTVYFVKTNPDGNAVAVHHSNFDNILTYEGTQIRIVGKKGIRIITSIPTQKRNDLLVDGIDGYNVMEYGTLMCWAKQGEVENVEPALIKNVSGNFVTNYGSKATAFSRATGQNAIYKEIAGTIQYTNNLVPSSADFTAAECVKDFAMRPYMILRPKGNTDSMEDIVIYGGTLYRSISYVAYQYRNMYTNDRTKYDYVWGLIDSNPDYSSFHEKYYVEG